MSEVKYTMNENLKFQGHDNPVFQDDTHGNVVGEGKISTEDFSKTRSNQSAPPTLQGDSEITKSSANPSELEIQLYKRRFWNLLLLVLSSIVNAMQWIQYSVLTDVTMCFYDVDLTAVLWTSNLSFITYVPLSFPASWFMNKVGLRYTMLVGTFCTCLGAAFQCFSLTPGTFSLVMLSQGISAIGQVFILSLPPFMAAVWFGSSEMSRACAVGVSSSLVGCALGFLLNPLIVPQDCSQKSLISVGKGYMAYGLAGASVTLLVLILLTFQDKPEKPPSIAEAKKTKITFNFKESIVSLLKNSNFVLLLLAFGIIYGVNAAIGISLNAIMITLFPGNDTIIGFMGLSALVSGNIGSVVGGTILDWIHKFKQISLAAYCFVIVSMIFQAGILLIDIIWIQFLTVASVGFLINGFLPIGYEFALEITYPLPESVSSQLMTASGMAFGLLDTMVAGQLLKSYGPFAPAAFFTSTLLLGLVIIVFVKCIPLRSEQEGVPSIPA